MALKPADRVKETTVTTSTGPYTLGGAKTGFQSFVAGVGVGPPCAYCVTDGVDWEVSTGIVATGPDTLSRDDVLGSSNAGDAVDWGAGTKDIFSVLPAGSVVYPGKNLIINGAMDVVQRGTSFTNVGGGAEEYILDRWLAHSTATSQARATITQETTGVFGGFGNSVKIDCTTAEAAVGVTDLWAWQQRIEAQDLQHLRYGSAAAEALVLTFQIKSPKSGTHCVSLLQPGGPRSYIREFEVASANTVEEVTVFFPGDASGTINNDVGEGLRLSWPLVAGTEFQAASDTWVTGGYYATSNQQNLFDNVANNFEITGVQLALGRVVMPFEYRTAGQELALCQRYYSLPPPPGALNFSSYTTGAITSWVIPFPAEMRVTPTTTVDTTGWTLNLCTILGYDGPTRGAARLIVQSTATNPNVNISNMLLGDLTANAEL